MYRLPSRRMKKHNATKPNLIPILDAVFIFIFFLLMSANFVQIFEISSDVPIISTSKPLKSKKKPLALTIKIRKNKIQIYTGIPSKLRKTINKISKKQFDLITLHTFLLKLKKERPSERTAIMEPIYNVNYELLVKIMDSVRMLNSTDTAIYYKDKNGMEKKAKSLFDNIVFGNIQS